MAYKTCPDCGSRIFEHGCVNCNEGDYISMQEEYEPINPVAVPLVEQEGEEGGYYYPLWKFFNDEHNLILLDSEIEEIIYQVTKFKNDN